MTRRLTAGVLCQQPPAGDWVFLPEGSELPGWANGHVGDHVLTVGKSAAPASAQVKDEQPTAGPEPIAVPPRSGKGSGRDAWADYADAHGLEIGESMDRGDIIAALDAAGIATED